MGLLSFLAKKAGIKGKDKPPLRAEPYVPNLSASLRPRGGYPVAGNDTDFKESLYRGRPVEFTESQVSLDTALEDEPPAPAPGIPRFRDEDIERPSTAPNARPSSLALLSGVPTLKRNGQKKPPPLSFRIPRPSTAAPGSRPGSRSSLNSIASAFRRAPGHSRADSLQSDGGRAFKDILDAQSEIKPADFRARVQAAGARDYGEDVAERNMGENGFDLGSEHVRAFYTQSKRVQRGGRVGDPAEDSAETSMHRHGLRRRSLRSSQLMMARHISAGSLVSSSPRPIRRGDVGRRRSVNTYVPPEFGKGRFPPGRDSNGLRDTSPRTQAGEIDNLDYSSSALKLVTPVMPQVPEAAPGPTIRTARRPRDSVEIAKRRAEVLMGEGAECDGFPESNFDIWSATRAHYPSTIPSTVSLPRKHRSLQTLGSSLSSPAVSRDSILQATPLSYPPKKAARPKTAGAPEARQDAELPPRSFPLLPTEEMRTTTDDAPLDDVLDFPPPIRTRSMRGWSASSGSPTAAESTTAGSIITSSTRFNRPPSLHTADTSVDLSIGAVSPQLKHAGSFARADSLTHDFDPRGVKHGETAVSADAPAFDVDDCLYADSLPGAAGHLSHPDDEDDGILNSNPNPNFSPLLPPELIPIPRPRSATTKPTTPHGNKLPNPYSTPEEVREGQIEQDTFNIDDYLSSDAESLTQTDTTPNRRPTAEGEEELLLNEAWFFSGRGPTSAAGRSGLQLPGLVDVVPFSSSSSSAGSTPLMDPSLMRGTSSGRVTSMVGAAGKGAGRRGMARMSLPLSLHVARGFELGGVEIGGGDFSARGGTAPATKRERGSERLGKAWERERQGRGKARVVMMDMAGDDEESESESATDSRDGWDDWRERDLSSQDNADDNEDDDGYDADYMDEESEGMSRRRHRRTRQTRRLSALCRLEGHEVEEKHPQRRYPERKHHQDGHETEAAGETAEDRIAAAVRLRKQVKKARRLAGQPSAAMLRRKESVNQRVGERMSVPALRVNGGAEQ